MKFRTVISAVVALVVVGCATPSQISADAEVDRLCAVDGGVKVYETVTLSADKFDMHGNFRVPSKQDAKASDNYYYEWIVSKIKGGNPHHDGTLVIEKSHFKYWRSRDRKLLGEQINYSRIGGDVPGPWHPSSYTCPSAHNTLSVDKQIFRNEVNK